MSSTLPRLRRLVPLALVATVLVVGCSDDDPGADGGAAADTTTEADAPAAGDPAAGATTAAPTTAPAAGGAVTATVPAGAAEVRIVDFAFTPEVITVQPGQTLVFTNTDSSVHAIGSFTSDLLASDELAQGDQFSVVFDTPGTYDYICTIHSPMTGRIEVTA